jgi:hypothetical protein
MRLSWEFRRGGVIYVQFSKNDRIFGQGLNFFRKSPAGGSRYADCTVFAG